MMPIVETNITRTATHTPKERPGASHLKITKRTLIKRRLLWGKSRLENSIYGSKAIMS